MSVPRSLWVEGNPRLHCLEWNPDGVHTILLLHGNSANAWWWAPLATSMPKKYRLIAIDLRGHGESEWVRPAAYGPANHAEDLARLIEIIGLERAIIAGHSMGGIAVAAFTRDYPQMARAAIVIDIAVTSTPRRNRFLNRLKVLPTVNYPDLATAVTRFRLMPNEGGIASEVIEEIARHSIRLTEDGCYTMKFDRESFYGGDGLDVEAALAATRIPALLIRAGLSRIMTAEAAERAAASNPQVQLKVIEGAHHHLPLERPDELARLMDEFVTALA
ncbi:MAG TPA: alpha/beta hydrolase [Candidatus Binataceae bacterium]|nr:alpha/beta hydrolase [Candidatus Binataceae bacterium]